MPVSSPPPTSSSTLHSITSFKGGNIERIADRVTNICERIIFMVTGEISSN